MIDKTIINTDVLMPDVDKYLRLLYLGVEEFTNFVGNSTNTDVGLTNQSVDIE